jgi:hypothetical protein
LGTRPKLILQGDHHQISEQNEKRVPVSQPGV